MVKKRGKTLANKSFRGKKRVVRKAAHVTHRQVHHSRNKSMPAKHVYTSSKVKVAVRNLLLFTILFLVSFFLYIYSSNSFYVNLFLILTLLFAFLMVSFMIVVLIFFILRLIRG